MLISILVIRDNETLAYCDAAGSAGAGDSPNSQAKLLHPSFSKRCIRPL